MGVSAAGFRETSVFNPSRLNALIRLMGLYRGSTANHSLWEEVPETTHAIKSSRRSTVPLIRSGVS